MVARELNQLVPHLTNSNIVDKITQNKAVGVILYNAV